MDNVSNIDELTNEVYAIKRELLLLRRCFMPGKEALLRMATNDNDAGFVLDAAIARYFADVAHDMTSLSELVELYRCVAAGLIDVAD